MMKPARTYEQKWYRVGSQEDYKITLYNKDSFQTIFFYKHLHYTQGDLVFSGFLTVSQSETI